MIDRPWAAAAAAAAGTAAAGTEETELLATLQAAAISAFSRRDFPSAEAALLRLAALEPANPAWSEGLGQVYTDGAPKQDFPAAVREYGVALELTPASDVAGRARLLAGRALAYEGVADWPAALRDYDAAVAAAAAGGLTADPYIMNRRGNVLAAAGDYAGARAAYLSSAAGFQNIRGVNTVGGSRLKQDGFAYAASNAALALAQMGDLDGAGAEMEMVSRRAPGNADMRAGLAALYWAGGRREDAEREWEFACDKISVGCTKFRDKEWLSRVRRWPPAMVAYLDNFLNLRD